MLTTAVAAFLLWSAAACAQDPRLARLDARVRPAIAAVIDSASRAGLPTEPLVDRALEGTLKGADGSRILDAVRELSADLHASRDALGGSASADEVLAGAHALRAGIPGAELARLRTAAGQRRLTMTLAVLTDLVARDVPVANASRIIVSLLRSGLRDVELSAFQRDVRLDIEHGADPGAAAATRARGALMHATTGHSNTHPS